LYIQFFFLCTFFSFLLATQHSCTAFHLLYLCCSLSYALHLSAVTCLHSVSNHSLYLIFFTFARTKCAVIMVFLDAQLQGPELAQIKLAIPFPLLFYLAILSVSRLYSPVIGWVMNMEQLMKWELVGEIEVLRENLPWCHFVHHKFHMTFSWI
jgi:hypothetical protein